MSDTLGDLLFLLLVPPMAVLLEKMGRIIYLLRKRQRDLTRYQLGNVHVEDLQDLTPKEFEAWCTDFLKSNGYEQIQILSSGAEGGKDIVCRKEGQTVYVECKRYFFETTTPFSIDLHVAEKFVGEMIHDGVSRGIIISTEAVTDAAKKYIESLPSNYIIELMDGEVLLQKCLECGIYPAVQKSPIYS